MNLSEYLAVYAANNLNLTASSAQMIRAHGLINSRVKHGRMPKPTHCETCGKESKLDGHHEDYMQPGVVAWLCRSCHMKRHHAIHKESLSLISR